MSLTKATGYRPSVGECRDSERLSVEGVVCRSPSASLLDDARRATIELTNELSDSRRTSSASDVTVIAREERLVMHKIGSTEIAKYLRTSGQ